MKRALLVGAVVLPVLAVGSSLAFRRPPRAEQRFRSGVFEPPRDAPGFTLDGSNGRQLTLRDHLGKIVILDFGYTFCQDVCPVTLARIAEVQKKLGSAARDVQLIYVTVDPKRDTAERLRAYLAAFDPSFLGATGTADQLAAVRNAYGAVASQIALPHHALGYAVNHSSSFYLIDREGKIHGLVPLGTPADDIVHDIELLLEKGP